MFASILAPEEWFYTISVQFPVNFLLNPMFIVKTLNQSEWMRKKVLAGTWQTFALENV
jgi:hypothetical protein